jgi:hypothetical protein
VATTQVSLVREHTERIRPPRALWVTFDLGRPFGIPGDVAFQTRVLSATLNLLAESSGPVIRDYPEPAPPTVASDGWTCPVNLPGPPARSAEDMTTRIADEIAALSPWYEAAARQNRGACTQFGISGLPIGDVVALLWRFASDGATADAAADLPAGLQLKHAASDLIAWYVEAAGAQPGATGPSSEELSNWFWGDTAAGALLLGIARRRADHPDPGVRIVIERNLVPWNQKHRLGDP